MLRSQDDCTFETLSAAHTTVCNGCSKENNLFYKHTGCQKRAVHQHPHVSLQFIQIKVCLTPYDVVKVLQVVCSFRLDCMGPIAVCVFGWFIVEASQFKHQRRQKNCQIKYPVRFWSLLQTSWWWEACGLCTVGPGPAVGPLYLLQGPSYPTWALHFTQVTGLAVRCPLWTVCVSPHDDRTQVPRGPVCWIIKIRFGQYQCNIIS